MKFTKIALTSAVLLATGSAMSAVNLKDGDVGTSESAAKAVVELVVGDALRVSDVDNITFTDSTQSTDKSDDICVYHRGDDAYNIKFSSATSGASAFEMVNTSDASKKIAYTVKYENKGSGSAIGTAETITYNTNKAFTTGANQTSISCGGSNNGTFYLTTDETTLLAAPTGTYQDTLVITVSPN